MIGEYLLVPDSLLKSTQSNNKQNDGRQQCLKENLGKYKGVSKDKR
jgi:hypothetical protein